MGQSPASSSINESDGIEFHQGKTCFGKRFLGVSPSLCNAPVKLAEAHTVLLCVRAPVGFPNITEREICIGRGLCALSGNGTIDNNYLFYSLIGKQSYFEKNSTGSTFKAISSKVIANTVLPLPPLSVQQSIVAELDKINEVIDLKKAQLKDLDLLAQSIFYEMFGDPIENPKGWEVKKLGEVCDFYNGKAHENAIDENGKYLLINSKFIASEAEVVKRTNEQMFPLYMNDITMVMSDVPNGRALAKCYLVKENGVYTLNQRICAFRNYTLNHIYFFKVLNRNGYFLRFNDGNGQTNLRKNDILNCPIPLPPLSLQQEFAKKIEAIEVQKTAIKQSLAEAETLLASRMDYWFN